jgi:hypothetical protein
VLFTNTYLETLGVFFTEYLKRVFQGFFTLEKPSRMLDGNQYPIKLSTYALP